jgi:hypothetical protein
MTDIYYKILSILKDNSSSGEFVELTEKLPDLRSENIGAACSILSKDKKIKIKSSGEYHFVFSVGSEFNNKTSKISAKILPAGIKYLEEINNSKSRKEFTFKVDDGHLGGKGSELFIKERNSESLKSEKSWFSRFWSVIVIPVFLIIIGLIIEYSWFNVKSIESDIVKASLISTIDSTLIVDKNLVIKKTVKEVFQNFDEAISSVNKKYAPISAWDYIREYLRKDSSNIENRIKNKSYITRFSKKISAWTENDIQEVNSILRIKTIDRIKEILDDIESKSQGPFVFSSEKIILLREQVKSEMSIE